MAKSSWRARTADQRVVVLYRDRGGQRPLAAGNLCTWMKGERASLRIATTYVRAAHLEHDPPPWILEDRLARSVVGEELFAAVEATVAAWSPDVFAAFRAHFTVRSRLAEDVAVEGMSELRNNYVLLGAGADTFAWRHPQAAAFTIWEIDHPASQAWKREALRRANLPVPPNVRFVAVDLAAVPLHEVELPSRATWNWLGVTQYLDKPTTESVLRVIAGQGSGTTAVVEFLLTEAECDELGAAFRAQGIAAAGQSREPMVSFYEPTEIERLLRRCGFGTIDLLATDTLRDRYLPPHSSGLRIPGAAIFATARV